MPKGTLTLWRPEMMGAMEALKRITFDPHIMAERACIRGMRM